MKPSDFTFTYTANVPAECRKRMDAALAAYATPSAIQTWRYLQRRRVDSLQAAANQNFRNALYQLQTRDRIYASQVPMSETEAMQADQAAAGACGVWCAAAGVYGSFPEQK